MKAVIRGKTYTIVLESLPRLNGSCDSPARAKPKITINPKLKNDKELLTVLIHEMLHACFWDMSEEAVKESADSMANVLYRLGARIEFTEEDSKNS